MIRLTKFLNEKKFSEVEIQRKLLCTTMVPGTRLSRDVFAYSSRGLRPAEKNHPTHRLIFQINFIVHDYFYGNKFKVTHSYPRTYVISKAKPILYEYVLF